MHDLRPELTNLTRPGRINYKSSQMCNVHLVGAPTSCGFTRKVTLVAFVYQALANLNTS